MRGIFEADPGNSIRMVGIKIRPFQVKYGVITLFPV